MQPRGNDSHENEKANILRGQNNDFLVSVAALCRFGPKTPSYEACKNASDTLLKTFPPNTPNLPKIFANTFQNLTQTLQILPKSAQNPCQSLPKRFPNPSKLKENQIEATQARKVFKK